MGTRENTRARSHPNSPEIMRTAVLLSLIAAARAFAPPSILRASVVVKNEADAASEDQRRKEDLCYETQRCRAAPPH
jgi:hypothetical protein